MKRFNNLYNQLTDMDNLRLAYHNAKKGKRHYREVKMIERDPERYLQQLQSKLLADDFVNSDYEVFKRMTSTKLREIYKLPFYPDRVVHHAIVQVLQPIWMSLLIRNTYSTIPKRGIHDGVKRVKESLKDTEGTRYCLKIDIRKYYPSVDHDVMKSILRKKIKDERMMSLLFTIIDSAEGIPIGNYISQWLGNVYLAYFDHYVKEERKVKHYHRYADDIVIFDASKERLRAIKTAIERYLNEHLKLEVKDNWQIFPVEARGVDFLGYVFYHTHTLIRKSIKQRFKKKISNSTANKHVQSSYWGWFKHADAYNLTYKYFTDERQQTKEAS